MLYRSALFRVLIDQARVTLGPVRLDIRSRSRRDVRNCRMRGIVADRGNADHAVAGMLFHVRVERDARAVVRPCRTPGFKLSFGDLHGVTAGRGYHIQMVPAVLIAQESDPLAIGRRPGLRSRFTPVGNAPEFFFIDFMNHLCGTGRGVGRVDKILLEVLRLTIKNKTIRVEPR